MEFTEALQQTCVLLAESQDYRLSEVDRHILEGTWSGLTYDDMANKSVYSLNYLMRDVAPRLWKLLSKAYGERVSKSNYHAVCERYEANADYSVPVSHSPQISTPIQRPDWGDAPDVPESGFFGRTLDFSELERWLLEEECRLVGLWGLPGIGKTSLAKRLAERVEPKFEFVVWRSLHAKPTLKTLSQDLLPRLTTEVPLGDPVTQLIEVLTQSRCLIILDGIETLLRNNDPWRRYEDQYKDYGIVFQRIAETPHQSCLILTSQEKPRELSLLVSPSQPVYLMEVKGIEREAALAFAEAYNLKDIETWQELCQRYDGHPTLLKQIATLSRDIFNGHLKELLEMSMMPAEVLKPIWNRLTTEEKRFLQQIASSRSQSVGLITAVSTFNKADSRDAALTSKAIQMIESLRAQSLIEVNTQQAKNNVFKTYLSLSKPVRKFVTIQTK